MLEIWRARLSVVVGHSDFGGRTGLQLETGVRSNQHEASAPAQRIEMYLLCYNYSTTNSYSIYSSYRPPARAPTVHIPAPTITTATTTTATPPKLHQRHPDERTVGRVSFVCMWHQK